MQHTDTQHDIELALPREGGDIFVLYCDIAKLGKSTASRGKRLLVIIECNDRTRPVGERPKTVPSHATSGIKHVLVFKITLGERSNPCFELMLVERMYTSILAPLIAKSFF